MTLTVLPHQDTKFGWSSSDFYPSWGTVPGWIASADLSIIRDVTARSLAAGHVVVNLIIIYHSWMNIFLKWLNYRACVNDFISITVKIIWTKIVNFKPRTDEQIFHVLFAGGCWISRQFSVDRDTNWQSASLNNVHALNIESCTFLMISPLSAWRLPGPSFCLGDGKTMAYL